MPSMPKTSKYKKVKPQQVRSRSNNELYNNRAWRRYSTQFRKDNPLCNCGCGRKSQCVDHVIPYNYEGSFWDQRNHQALSNHCHFVKSGKESHGIYEDWTMNKYRERIPRRGAVRKSKY